MLHVICGAPCAGKSTFVKTHAQPNDVIIDTDTIAQALGAQTEHLAKGNHKNIAILARNRAIEEALKSDGNFWIIDSTPSTETIERYKAQNAEIHILNTSEEVCIERAIADKRPAETIGIIKEWYKKNQYLINNKELNNMEFKPILTEEEYENRIKDRIEQEREKLLTTFKNVQPLYNPESGRCEDPINAAYRQLLSQL